MPHRTVDASVFIRATLAERIQSARIAAGMTQDEVQETTGHTVGGGLASRWESGRSQPHLADLVALADLFGVSTDWLLGRTETP